MIFINNELPLYIHEIRALCRAHVEKFLVLQNKGNQEDTTDSCGCETSGLIDLYKSLMSVDARRVILDLASEIFFYFDDHARNELGHDIDSYKEFVRKQFIYFLEDPEQLFSLSPTLLQGCISFFVDIMKIIKVLFDIEFTFHVSGAFDHLTAITPSHDHEFRQLVHKAREELNEMYFMGKNHYLAHSGDTAVVTKRGMPASTVVHCGYMLAHLSMSERGPLYDESMTSLAGNLSEHRIENLKKYARIDRIPLFLDNSAFELGVSAQHDILIDWYHKLRETSIVDCDAVEVVFILPDVLADHEQTLKGSIDFLYRLNREESLFDETLQYGIMMVVQDSEGKPSSFEQRKENFKEMVEKYYTEQLNHFFTGDASSVPPLWVGFPMMRRDEDNVIQFDQGGSHLRVATLNSIAKDWETISSELVDRINSNYQAIYGNKMVRFIKDFLDIRFHILGCISPIEYSDLSTDAKNMISSLDTSFPFGVTAVQLGDIPPSIKPKSDYPKRPWHRGSKIPSVHSKPFSMTAIPARKHDNTFSGNELDNNLETRDIVNLQFLTYQLNMWYVRLRQMGINQRMFEEWVGDVWADY